MGKRKWEEKVVEGFAVSDAGFGMKNGSIRLAELRRLPGFKIENGISSLLRRRGIFAFGFSGKILSGASVFKLIGLTHQKRPVMVDLEREALRFFLITDRKPKRWLRLFKKGEVTEEEPGIFHADFGYDVYVIAADCIGKAEAEWLKSMKKAARR